MRARVLHALGRVDESEREWQAALAVDVADPDDRQVLERDLAHRPGAAVS